MKYWFITGISSGLGKALSEAVMAKGDFVIGTFRKASEADAFNKKFAKKGHALQLDITDPAGVAHCVDFIRTNYEGLDILVNNAGVGFVGAIEETTMEEARQVLEVNFFAALKLTQSILPIMRKACNGHIVQVSSHGGIKAFAGFGIYNASKFALEGFSEALAQEVAPLGIQVSIVEPGPFRTDFAGRNLGIAKHTIADYNSTAGNFKAKLIGVNGKQEGDPEKAAQAIIDQVYAKRPTLRLPLGKTALITIETKIESVKSDLETHRPTAENAVFA